MKPRSVAVIGASEKAGFGKRALDNLLHQGFQGGVYPVNPRYPELAGVRCYPDLESLPEAPDCAVIVSPLPTVPDLLEVAARRRVPAAIVMAGGYAESGPEGARLQEALVNQCRAHGILLCGPNCLGIANIGTGAVMYGVPMGGKLLQGGVGLIGQSGGVTIHTTLTLMRTRGVGFSHFISCGNQADITLEEYIRYLIEDDGTQVVVVFAEGFRRAPDLRELGRLALERDKPIIVFKAGNSPVAARMARAHTGSLAGDREVARAALRQFGVIQVHSHNELVETISLFSCRAVLQRYRGGRRLAVLTGSGGTCSIVADAGHAAGLEFPELAEATRERIRAVLPSYGEPRNPVDGTDVMFTDQKMLPAMLGPLLEDPNLDFVAVNIGAQVPSGESYRYWRPMSEATVALADKAGKPVVAFNPLIGGARDPEVVGLLREGGVPFLDGTELALTAIANLARYRSFRETARDDGPGAVRPAAQRPPLDRAPNTKAAFELLRTYGIPVVPTALARDADAVVQEAARLGYPVALKVESADVPHKTDAGGVALALGSEAEVRDAFKRVTAAVAQRHPGAAIDGVVVQRMAGRGLEMILGIKRDPEFGPAVVCGLGGIYTEVFADVAIGIPPLGPSQAERMLRSLKCWPLLDGARGLPPADVPALRDALVALSRLAADLGSEIEGMDINPLIVHPSGQGVSAVDALFVMPGAST